MEFKYITSICDSFANNNSALLGESVTISDNLITVTGQDSDNTANGNNYILKKGNNTWNLIQEINLPNGSNALGKKIQIYKNYLIIGDFKFSSNKGRVIIYEFN